MKTDPRLKDKQWRLNHLYFIKDKAKNLIQFALNKAQDHFHKHKHFRNVILKSRQLGFTTYESMDSLDDALFTRNFDALLIAHTLDVAKDIFDNKVYLAWENYRLKNLYSEDMSSARKLKVGFGDKTYSSITVDTSGRAGTYHRLHVTELAKLAKQRPDRAKEIIEGSIPAVPTTGRVDIESTSEGIGGEFYEIFNNAWGRKPRYNEEYKAHFYNWTWDEDVENAKPIKVPQKFKEYQKLFKLTDLQISYYYKKFLSLNEDWNSLRKEYPTTPEEAFSVILEGAYYENQIKKLLAEGRFTKIPYDQSLKVHTVWDLGMDDSTAIGFFQKAGHELRMIDYLEASGEGLSYYARRLQEKEYYYGMHIAPHDIQVRELGTGKSRLEVAEQLGIRFDIAPNVSIEDGIQAGRIVFNRLWIDEKCKPFIDKMKQYRKEWDDKVGCFKNKPFHDFTSHAADMFRYFALSEDMFDNSGTKIHKQDFKKNSWI